MSIQFHRTSLDVYPGIHIIFYVFSQVLTLAQMASFSICVLCVLLVTYEIKVRPYFNEFQGMDSESKTVRTTEEGQYSDF